MYLQYGCGLTAPESWENFDVSPTMIVSKIPVLGALLSKKDVIPAWPNNVRYGDITKGLPIPNNSCKAVYCSHVLEHLALEDFRIALHNTYRMLVGGGTFRFVLPNLEQLASKYINSNDSQASLKFMRESYLGKESRQRGIKGLLKCMLGNSSHLWMWDYQSISEELSNIGFTEIRKAKFGDSTDKMFKKVELEGRWENCLGVECKR
jgi:ubiquinone/menaquinone biosynthesis C-methylase UbiE